MDFFVSGLSILEGKSSCGSYFLIYYGLKCGKSQVL